MKVRLLKKLRNEGRDQVHVHSTTSENGIITGMSYSHPGEGYRDLFCMGTTEDELKDKACIVWLSKNIQQIRERYKKYTRKYKLK